MLHSRPLGSLLLCSLFVSSAPGLFAAEGGEENTLLVNAESVLRYIDSCRKPNGAFGPKDQEYTDAAWNFPAVHTLDLLGEPIANRRAILEHGLGYPRGHRGVEHWLVFHQAMIRKLAQEAAERTAPASDSKGVKLVHQGYKVLYYNTSFGANPNPDSDGALTQRRFHESTELGFYNLASLYYLLAALDADGRRPANTETLIRYILDRQAPGGGFVDVRDPDTKPADDEAHISHTFHAVAALKLLGEEVPQPRQCAQFVRSCQIGANGERVPLRQRGSFLWNPKPDLPGNSPDVYYAWAAVRTLALLSQELEKPQALIAWINSLQNYDGGFGDRPGWRSRLYSTYYAVHALDLLMRMQAKPADRQAGKQLSGFAKSAIHEKRLAKPPQELIPQGQYQIYQALFKVPVIGPGDLEGLHARGLNLLGLKTDRNLDADDFSLAESLQKAIGAKGLAMDVVLCPEAYHHLARRFGGPMLHHIGNFTLDPRWNDQQRKQCMAAYDAGGRRLPWAQYQEQVLQPLQQLGALCYPEQDFEMEYAYSAYDGDSGLGGYNAVLAGFNWSPRDFVRVFPWRERFVDKLPPIADVDAHNTLEAWSPQLDYVRNVYLARGPSYEQFLDAARHGRVACIVHKPAGVPSGVTYYGSPAVVDYVKQRVDEWKWWK